MMRFMFSDSGSKSVVGEMKVESRLQALRAMRPKKMQGRFVFLADCQASLAETVPLAERGAIGRNMMARHSS
eukprot:12221845-Heterocapsa_arctica.AAC.1